MYTKKRPWSNFPAMSTKLNAERCEVSPYVIALESPPDHALHLLQVETDEELMSEAFLAGMKEFPCYFYSFLS